MKQPTLDLIGRQFIFSVDFSFVAESKIVLKAINWHSDSCAFCESIATVQFMLIVDHHPLVRVFSTPIPKAHFYHD